MFVLRPRREAIEFVLYSVIVSNTALSVRMYSVGHHIRSAGFCYNPISDKPSLFH